MSKAPSHFVDVNVIIEKGENQFSFSTIYLFIYYVLNSIELSKFILRVIMFIIFSKNYIFN